MTSSDHIPVLVEWARERPAIRALLLTSTRAIPTAYSDRLSDYDVILVVDDLQPFVADHTWLNDFGEVLVVYWDAVHPDPDFAIDVCGNVTQYADGLKIDFTLWPVALLKQKVAAPALPDELDAGYRVLLDKDHLTDSMQSPTGKAYIPIPPTRTAYETWINDFLSDAPYVAKCLWRDELLPAKWCLDYDMKHIYLRQMLEWYVGVEYGWSIPVGSLGKGLKKRLPPALWDELEACFAGAELEANWLALAKTLALFRQVAIAVGEHLGYPYPDDLHQRVCTYVEEIRSLTTGEA